MNNQYYKILVIFSVIVIFNLTSCANIANRDRSKTSGVSINEAGNVDDCAKQNGKPSSNCNADVY